MIHLFIEFVCLLSSAYNIYFSFISNYTDKQFGVFKTSNFIGNIFLSILLIIHVLICYKLLENNRFSVYSSILGFIYCVMIFVHFFSTEAHFVAITQIILNIIVMIYIAINISDVTS